jgi:hypothetical protein
VRAFDWLLGALALCCAAAHIYFAVRYREYFVVDKDNAHQSYWSMIQEFRRHHRRPAAVLIAVVWLQVAVVAAMAAQRLLA